MVIPKGIITLPVTIGKVPHRMVHMIDFLTVDHPGAYNIILRRLFLTTNATIFIYYLAMKIPTVKEIITIKRDQQSARGCYFVTLKASYQIAANIFLEGYSASIRPPINLSKKALARRRRVARKKAQRSTNSQQQQEVGPMEMDIVASRAPQVPQSLSFTSMREVEVPLILRYRKMKSDEHWLRILCLFQHAIKTQP